MAAGEVVIYSGVFLFVALTVGVSLRINAEQPAPYMDELFHVPQAQRYCLGNYSEWDPMITTLPGLYMVSVGLVRPVGAVLGAGAEVCCSLVWLRGINILFTLGTLYLIHLILARLHRSNPVYSDSSTLLASITLSSLPVLYFFAFLYYTDAGSTFFVLFAHLLSLHAHHWPAVVMATLAVTFRQTNVVWLAFFAATSAIDVIKARMPSSNDRKSDGEERKKEGEDRKQEIRNEGVEIVMWALRQMMRDWRSCIGLIAAVLRVVCPYAIALLGFVAFIALNGGIVVGAKQDHQAVFNVPQIFYFFAFVGAFSCVNILDRSTVEDFLRFVLRRPLVVATLLLASAAAVWQLTMVHRYTLADNRHYTFYVWARVYQRYTIARYALIPAYLYVGYAMVLALSRSRNSLWIVAYFACVAACLIPSPLLELRYFIAPYLLFRLHAPLTSHTWLVVELLLHVALNAVTIYVFLERPFKWSDSDELQRFMW